MTSDTERASVPASIAESFITGDPVHASASRSSGPTLSNAETLELFFQVVDVKFNQKFAAFKRDLYQKETAIQSQLKKLKTESKDSSSFNSKENKVQYEFNSSLLDAIDGAIKTISKGNLPGCNSELERVKTRIPKRNKLIHFVDKSPAGWTAVEEYESDKLADDSEDEKKILSAGKRALVKIRGRSVKMCLASLTVQLPIPKQAKLHLLVCPLEVCLLLISLFFFACMQSLHGHQTQSAKSALAADREATRRILPHAQAVLEEHVQPSQ